MFDAAHVNGMGHQLATIAFSAEEAHAIKAGGSDLLSAAVTRWYDEEANRYEDARPGDGYTAPLMVPEAVNRYLDSHLDQVFNRSVIIPVAGAEDTVAKKKRVRVHIDADALAEAHRQAALAGRFGHSFGSTHKINIQVQRTLGEATFRNPRIVKLPKLRKPVAQNTPGSIVTEYHVVTAQGSVVANGSTVAEAKRNGTKYASEHPTVGSLTIVAVPVRVAEDGTRQAAVATITSPEPEGGYAVDVEVEVLSLRPGAKPASYEVMFDYHS